MAKNLILHYWREKRTGVAGLVGAEDDVVVGDGVSSTERAVAAI